MWSAAIRTNIRPIFEQAYHQTKAAVISHVNSRVSPPVRPMISDWVTQLFDYNLPGGKCYRGKLLLDAACAIHPDLAETTRLTADNDTLQRICRLGWTVEMLHAFYIIVDDIMDQSETRRGHSCYYKLKSVGLRAFNDGELLRAVIPDLIRTDWASHPQYPLMLKSVDDTHLVTVLGQHLDGATTQYFDINDIRPDMYDQIVDYKTSHYTFYFPLQLALLASGVCDQSVLTETHLLANKIGRAFQIQDDYLDLYGDPNVTGKIGTDILERKCTWFLARAISNPIYQKQWPKEIQQLKAKFQSNRRFIAYDEFLIKNIYKTLGLKEDCELYLSSELEQFTRMCHSYSLQTLQPVLKRIAEKIDNRSK